MRCGLLRGGRQSFPEARPARGGETRVGSEGTVPACAPNGMLFCAVRSPWRGALITTTLSYEKRKKNMDSSAYNRYLAAIKEANACEASRARELLRQIQADMIANYGASDRDVEYLIRQFRYNI